MNPLGIPQVSTFLREAYRSASSKGMRLFLVGGIIRDSLMRRTKANPDIDLCTAKGALSFGRHLAQILRAGYVVLDKERGYCRLVARRGKAAYTLDITDFRGATLEEDLRLRDFTVDAMAADVAALLKKGPLSAVLIDPYGGKADLAKKVLRLTDKGNIEDDPLRILRAVSLSATLGFSIERSTLSLMKRQASGLAKVSAERVRDELFKVFGAKDSYAHFLLLGETRILDCVVPELSCMRGVKQGPYHHLDVWKHSFETLRQLELMEKSVVRSKVMRAYLGEEVSSGRTRWALMKLAALLHDVGKPAAKRRKDKKTIFHGHERIGASIARSAAERLRLSNDETAALAGMVFWHLRPGYLGDNPEVTPRAQFRFFRDTGREGVSTLLLSIADQRSTRGPLTSKEDAVQHEKICFGLIKAYFRKQKEVRQPRLLNGDELMGAFGLAPSPLVGKILGELEELQAIGSITTKAQALAAAKKLLP